MWSKFRTFISSPICRIVLSPVPPIIAANRPTFNEDPNRPTFNPSNGPSNYINGYNHSNYNNRGYHQFTPNNQFIPNSNQFIQNIPALPNPHSLTSVPLSVLPSLDVLNAAIDEKDNDVISEYETKNKRRSKIKRNGWILGYFIEFLMERVSLDDGTITEIENHPMKLLPKYYCSDKVLAAFISRASESVLASTNSYKSFIRGLESTLSDMCVEYKISNDFKSSSFFQAKAIMLSCKSSKEYKNDQPTQARACSTGERKEAMNIILTKNNGQFDDIVLTEKAGYVLSTCFMARGDEIYRGIDQDLVFNIDNNGCMYAQWKIYSDKTRTKSYYKSVYCDEINQHNQKQYNKNACPVAVLQLYQERKQQSIKYMKTYSRITSATSKQILADPLQGALIRRVKAKKQKDFSKGTYISLQRRGPKQLDFIQQIAVRLRWNMEKRLGQADKFNKHSGKRTGIVECCEEAYDKLCDSEKLALSGHKRMEMFDYYGGAIYKSRNAAKKFADIKKQNKICDNNNNMENVPPMSLNVMPTFNIPPLPVIKNTCSNNNGCKEVVFDGCDVNNKNNNNDEVIFDGIGMNASFYISGNRCNKDIKQEK